MEVISGVTAEAVNHPTTRPSPPVGDSWTDSMEGAIGIATHHDGMSGAAHCCPRQRPPLRCYGIHPPCTWYGHGVGSALTEL